MLLKTVCVCVCGLRVCVLQETPARLSPLLSNALVTSLQDGECQSYFAGCVYVHRTPVRREKARGGRRDQAQTMHKRV